MIYDWMLKNANKRMGFFIMVIPSLFFWFGIIILCLKTAGFVFLIWNID